jgi:hypothetical protein
MVLVAVRAAVVAAVSVAVQVAVVAAVSVAEQVAVVAAEIQQQTIGPNTTIDLVAVPAAVLIAAAPI